MNVSARVGAGIWGFFYFFWVKPGARQSSDDDVKPKPTWMELWSVEIWETLRKKKRIKSTGIILQSSVQAEAAQNKIDFFCHSLENIGPAVTEQIKRTALQNHWRFQTRSHSYTLPYLAMLELSLILSGERLSLPPALPNAPQLHLNTPFCSLKSFQEKQKKQTTLNSYPLEKKDDCTTIQAGN